MNTVKRRPYRSPRRQGHARETRQRILSAARDLFIARGYGATTIDAIAEAADVAPQTVYAGLSSKRGILFALLDQMAVDADLPGLEADVMAAAGDPFRQLRERIAFTTRFYAGGIALIEIARTVSGIEADLGAMWGEGESRRYRAYAPMVKAWEEAGVLAPGLTAEAATDMIWALGGPDVFRLLVVERGWSRERFEDWLFATLKAAIFAPSAAGDTATPAASEVRRKR